MNYLYDYMKAKGLNSVEGYAAKELRWLQTLDAQIHHPGKTMSYVELKKLEPPESWAFYIKSISEMYMDKGAPQGIEYLRQHVLKPQDVQFVPFDWLYTLAQQHDQYRHAFFWMKWLCGSPAQYLQLSFDVWKVLITRRPSADVMMWFATNGRSDKFSAPVAKYCHPTFLPKCNDMKKVKQLIRDTNINGIHSIQSMNQLQAMHDEQAAETKRLAHKEKLLLSYSDEFMHVCEKYQWHVPRTSAEFIERGNEHHNCVANYIRRQYLQPTNDGSVSRVIMQDDKTAEVIVGFKDDKVSSVKLQQCKGNRNCDKPFENWTDFAAELKQLPRLDFRVRALATE